MARTPKLLVSVRSTDEVHAVIRGGADIVDVKEPNNGPLGNASALTVERISAVMTEKACEQPLSVALGELVDWINPSMEKQELRAVLKRVRPAFLKMGLAGVCQPGRDWKTLLDGCRDQFPATSLWVAVAYADHDRALSPSPWDVARYAIDHGCAGLLIDTFRKDGTNLCHWLNHEQLIELRSITANARIFMAIAGRVTEDDLPELLDVSPEIVAVRGAVCEDGDRNRSVCEDRVRSFRKLLNGEPTVRGANNNFG